MADTNAPAGAQSMDGFTLALPLPYRAAIIIVTGIWAWGFNLKALGKLQIDVPSLIRYTSKASPGNPPWRRIHTLAFLATITLLGSLVAFWVLTRGNETDVLSWYGQGLPIAYLLGLAFFFAIPMQRFSRNGRYRFLSTLKRISIGGLAESQDGKFGDILLADALTSYSRVLGDLAVAFCMLFTGKKITSRPTRKCGRGLLFPLVLCIPSLIRLRQCLIEFKRVRQHPESSSGGGWQHLANALKYASIFPVIFLSTMQGSHLFDLSDTLSKCWLVAAIINACYSFYWDVTKDWDLTILTQNRKDVEHPYGLRRRLHFKQWYYYAAIGGDFLLRFAWALKLSNNLDHEYLRLEGIVYLLQFLEVGRRWIWIFFRVETEWVRSQVGPLPDDILLGEYERTDFDKLDID